MSTSLEDIMYDDYVLDQARQEMEAVVIEDFRQDILKRYYLKNPAILQPAQKMNYDAVELDKKGFHAASLIYNFSATEILIKEIIIKPLLHGSIIDEELANLLSTEMVERMKNHSLYSKIFTNFVRSFAGLDARNYKGVNLISKLEKINKKRNEIIHHGATATREEALGAIQISKLYYWLVTDVMRELGLKVNRDSWEIELK